MTHYNRLRIRYRDAPHQLRQAEARYRCRHCPLLETLLEELRSEGNNISARTFSETSQSPASESDPRGPDSASQDWASGRLYMTKAGIRVRSKAEKIIADCLTDGGVRFVYEPLLKVGGHTMRPDFYLLDYDLPYEHFGLDTPDYLRAKEAKIARYRAADIPFMFTTYEDEPDIEDAIVDKLLEATIDL
jgi:hypothetical protein